MSDQATSDFRVRLPIGYVVERACNAGHAVVFKHVDVGNTWTPFVMNGNVMCVVCIADTTGLACTKPHLSFDVGVSE